MAALLAITIMGMSGLAVIHLSSSEAQSNVYALQSQQAFYVAQAGLEYAQERLHQGLNPAVNNYPFGPGHFSITTDPASGLITVIGQVGEAMSIQSINASFSKNCVVFDTSTAHTDQFHIKEVKLVKSCNDAAIVTKMWIDWDWSDCVLNSSNPLAECPLSHASDHVHGNAVVQHISIEATEIYNPGQGIGLPGNGGADPNVEIDVVDFQLTTNGVFEFIGPPHPIRLSKKHPGHGLYIMRAQFADGSIISTTFVDSTNVQVPQFSNDYGQVQASSNTNIAIQVLGSNIFESSTGAEIPVTVELGLSSTGTPPFTYSTLYQGMDVDGGESHSFNSGTSTVYFRVRATAQYGYYYAQFDSKNNAQVKTLANGENVPPLQGFGGTEPIMAFLSPYLDAQGRAVLQSNQLLMLFELSSPDSIMPSPDYQDLVVLITLNVSPNTAPTVQDNVSTDTTSTSSTSSNSTTNTTGGTTPSDSDVDVFFKQILMYTEQGKDR